LAARNALVCHYLYLTREAAASVGRRLPRHVEYDDLVSAAASGLINAIETWDSNGGASFNTWVRPRISGSILDWLRHIDPQSRSIRQFERRRDQAADGLACQLDRQPRSEDIAARLAMPLPRFREYQAAARAGEEVRLSRIGRVPGDPDSIGEIADARRASPAAALTRAWLAQHIVRHLPDRRARRVLVMYFYDDLTLREIGLVEQVSESRVSQILSQLLATLREAIDRGIVEELVA